MIPGFAAAENLKFLPSDVVRAQPTRFLRYQLTSAGSRVSKLYWMSHHGSTPRSVANPTQLSLSVTLCGKPPIGLYPAASGFFGSFRIINVLLPLIGCRRTITWRTRIRVSPTLNLPSSPVNARFAGVPLAYRYVQGT